jgi:hypothetical protein
LANARAVARPMPVSPPVIKTTWVFIEFLLETFSRPNPNPNLHPTFYWLVD